MLFVINLEGSTERLMSVQSELDKAGLSFTRVTAFDGRNMPIEQMPLYNEKRAKRRFGRILTGGEVGCFLSHLEAARQFLASDATYGLVLEDDLIACAEVAVILRHLTEKLQHDAARYDWRLINLGRAAKYFYTDLGDMIKGYHLVRAHYFPVTTSAIFWNREGAQMFLEQADEIIKPVDHWLRDWASVHDCGLSLHPPLFSASQEPSVIDAAQKRGELAHGLWYVILKHRQLFYSKINALFSKMKFKYRLKFSAGRVADD